MALSICIPKDTFESFFPVLNSVRFINNPISKMVFLAIVKWLEAHELYEQYSSSRKSTVLVTGLWSREAGFLLHSEISVFTV